MAFDRKDYGINENIPFMKIANRVEVNVSLKWKRVSGPSSFAASCRDSNGALVFENYRVRSATKISKAARTPVPLASFSTAPRRESSECDGG